MKSQHYALYALALAILIVGLTLAGVSAERILLGLIVLACPLMMMFMMGGGHGHGFGGHHRERERQQEDRSRERNP